MGQRLSIALTALLLLGIPALAAGLPEDNSSAVILAYMRVGEDAWPDSSITTEQFREHIAELTDGGYNVAPLPVIIDALKKHTPLPPHTVAITFEGAYRSALENAIPLLLEKKLPFTVFYASGYEDSGTPQHMGWGDLKSLAQEDGVTLGLFPASYTRLHQQNDTAIRTQINAARVRHRAMIGGEPAFFAYPFGEYTTRYKKLVRDQGFLAAFGLDSGVAYAGADPMSLPRFTMTERYGDIDRFKTVVSALPLPVKDITPQDMTIGPAPLTGIGFTVSNGLRGSLKTLSCFISGQPKPAVEIIDARVEIRPQSPLQDRARVNCTIPVAAADSEEPVRTRWFGLLAFVKDSKADNAEDDGEGGNSIVNDDASNDPAPPALP